MQQVKDQVLALLAEFTAPPDVIRRVTEVFDKAMAPPPPPWRPDVIFDPSRYIVGQSRRAAYHDLVLREGAGRIFDPSRRRLNDEGNPIGEPVPVVFDNTVDEWNEFRQRYPATTPFVSPAGFQISVQGREIRPEDQAPAPAGVDFWAGHNWFVDATKGVPQSLKFAVPEDYEGNASIDLFHADQGGVSAKIVDDDTGDVVFELVNGPQGWWNDVLPGAYTITLETTKDQYQGGAVLHQDPHPQQAA